MIDRLTDAQNTAIVAQLSPELEPSTPLPSWDDVAMETIYLRNHIAALEAQVKAADGLVDGIETWNSAIRHEFSAIADDLEDRAATYRATKEASHG